jgi:hypothetical protein
MIESIYYYIIRFAAPITIKKLIGEYRLVRRSVRNVFTHYLY